MLTVITNLGSLSSGFLFCNPTHWLMRGSSAPLPHSVGKLQENGNALATARVIKLPFISRWRVSCLLPHPWNWQLTYLFASGVESPIPYSFGDKDKILTETWFSERGRMRALHRPEGRPWEPWSEYADQIIESIMEAHGLSITAC